MYTDVCKRSYSYEDWSRLLKFSLLTLGWRLDMKMRYSQHAMTQTTQKGRNQSEWGPYRLDHNKPYKYLEIEIDGIQRGVTKERLKKEFVKWTKQMYKSKLSGCNKFTGYNQYAVPIIQYSAGIMEWFMDEIQEIDCKSRKIMNMYKASHPWADERERKKRYKMSSS